MNRCTVKMLQPLLFLLCVYLSSAVQEDEDACTSHSRHTYFLPYGRNARDIIVTPNNISQTRHQFGMYVQYTAFGQVYTDQGYKVKPRKGRSTGTIRIKPHEGFDSHGTLDVRIARLQYTGGTIYMRSTKFVTDLEPANDLINEAYPCLKRGSFKAKEISVFTFQCMEYENETQSFQAAIAVDDAKTYVIMIFHKLVFNESLQYGIKHHSTKNTYRLSGGNRDNLFLLTKKTNGIRPGVWVIDVTDSYPRRPESCSKLNFDCTMTSHALVNTFDDDHYVIGNNSYKTLSFFDGGANDKCNFVIRAKTTYGSTVKYVDLSSGPYSDNDLGTMDKHVFGRQQDIVHYIDPTLAEVADDPSVDIPEGGLSWPPNDETFKITKEVDNNNQVSWTVSSKTCGYSFVYNPAKEPTFKLTLDEETYKWDMTNFATAKVSGLCGNFNGDKADDKNVS